ncbi:MAG: aldo/keto reductase, partial [Actinobacteria bacterium]|nr:aldo/keto reductase [Actinomycetota bacterium]
MAGSTRQYPLNGEGRRIRERWELFQQAFFLLAQPPTGRHQVRPGGQRAVQGLGQTPALDAGVRLLDTADIYAPTWNTIGHNEILVMEALRTWSGTPQQKSEVVVATKGGSTRTPLEGDWFGVRGRNASETYLYRAVEASAARMQLSKIKLWQHHRLNHTMPFEEQFENVMKLKAHGIVENIGVSNYNAEQLRRAIKIGGTPAQGGLVSVQNEWSPRSRNNAEVREICAQYGIAFLPWSPLGGAEQA